MAPKQYSNFHCAYICEQLQMELLHTDELPFKLIFNEDLEHYGL